MDTRFIRTKLLIGSEKQDILKQKHIAVFGVGGVGGYVCEALARCGVGNFTIVDRDTVNESNINRQIIALSSTVGRAKVDVMKERMRDINPDVRVEACKVFYLPQNASEFDFTKYDYVVDAVDTVTAKLQLITAAKEANVPVISSMGAGNKLDPSLFRIADISKTSVCPLAKVMRRELKSRGIKNVKCVYSTEEAIKHEGTEIGSIAFVPSVAGLMIASEVIKDLIDQDK